MAPPTRREYVGPEPEGAAIEQQGLGWKQQLRHRRGDDTITSGLEGAWTKNPVKWDNGFFENLFGYEWELTKSPAGAHQWTPKDPAAAGTVPDAHDPSKRHAPMMLTTDLALRMDPIYEPISRRFLREPGSVRQGLRRGVVQADPSRHGPAVALPRPGSSGRTAAVAGPGSRRRSRTDRCGGHRRAQGEDPRLGAVHLAAGRDRLGFGGDVPRLATSAAGPTGRAFASHRRRIGRSTNRQSWPSRWRSWRQIQTAFNAAQSGGKKVSLADLIVLGGCAAVEQAAKNAGHTVQVPFHAGPHRCVAGADRCRLLRRARAQGGRVPQLHAAANIADRPRRCWSIGRSS